MSNSKKIEVKGIRVKDMPGWVAKRILTPMGAMRHVSYDILNPKGLEVGVLRSDGVLCITKSVAEMRENIHVTFLVEHVTNKRFGTNVREVRQAMRYLYLTTQKKNK